VHVSPEDVYTSERGYGFDFGSKPLDSARGAESRSPADLSPPTEPPLFFSVKVPEGNYRITVTLGDARANRARPSAPRPAI
jgi:hypothetical protein